MDYQYLPGTFLLQLGLFIGCSGLLYVMALAIAKTLPNLIQWSRFWQAWLLLALLPLLPVSFQQVNTVIPEVLKTAFGDTRNDMLIHSSSVVSQIDDQPALQVGTGDDHWRLLPVAAAIFISAVKG